MLMALSLRHGRRPVSKARLSAPPIKDADVTAHSFDAALRDRIAARLAAFPREPADHSALRQAAVALVVTRLPATGEGAVLVTLRPSGLNRHGGQYALPGGRLDEGESDADAALRELREELGLTLDTGAILGRLDDFPTRSGFRIAPLVMWAEACAITPDPAEVAEVYRLPLSELDSPDIPRLTPARPGDQPVMSAFFPTIGHFMYAPTAAILYQFREVALRGLPTRTAHFEQPRFAWK